MRLSVVVDLLLINGLQLVNCDVMQLSIIIGHQLPEYGYGQRM